ncbi:MAG: ADP-heptose--LPS heptosyltransferase, partial [Gemmatimonadetes bacterium]|nr:ADP-heptose--LPS heptosyltransferase [Gemmatimonadota bacterium]
RKGEFELAWAVSDRILASPTADQSLPRHQRSVWAGKSLAVERVLIRCHHGLGDTIQFIRYAPLVSELAGEVTVCAQAGLLPLLATARGIDRLLPLDHDRAGGDGFDVEVEVMELPFVFRTTLRTIPADVPYLEVEPAPRPADDKLAVGLVWGAGDWDTRRSVPAGILEPLGSIPGVTLYLMQRGAALAERPAGFGVPWGSDDVLEASRIMRALDLVISVDSMPAHLAGALGIPVWTMLRANADWRWMERRNDTPWYPTMRLFRQEEEGDWGPVVARIVRELRGGREGAGVAPGGPPHPRL